MRWKRRARERVLERASDIERKSKGEIGREGVQEGTQKQDDDRKGREDRTREGVKDNAQTERATRENKRC